MAFGTMIVAGISVARSMMKKKKKAQGGLSRGFISGGTGNGPVLFEDTSLPPGGGVLARTGSQKGGGMIASGKGKGTKADIDPETGEITEKPRRRRRRRLLTCADRADITFITATLGKGEIAKTAIASLLSRC